MSYVIRQATIEDTRQIAALIGFSVRILQPQYTPTEREAALATVFTVDSRLIADGTYFVVMAGEVLAGCGGWSFRKTLYGGDHQMEQVEPSRLNPLTDAAKIRAIFVHPDFARRGLGGLLLRTAEEAATAAGFTRYEMGSTLAGVGLYVNRGYRETSRIAVPVGDEEHITVVRMEKGILARSSGRSQTGT